MLAFIRTLQPGCVVVANNDHQLADSDVRSYEFPWKGDLPPAENREPAEICDTIQTDQRWFWRENHSPSDLQSADAVVEKIRTCRERHANYLLDVPPDKDGLISGPQLARLRQIGDLLRQQGVLEPD